MNTRSKVSLSDIPIKNLQLSHQKRRTNTTKSSSLSNISSISMSSKDYSNEDSSDVQVQITNEQIKNLCTDNKKLQKQLETKTLLVEEDRLKNDDSSHSNQQSQENQQTCEEGISNLNDIQINVSHERPSLLDFLRNHILPFSGNENAYQWFIEIDSTFSNLKLSFDDRQKILPYFFVGRSMIWYSLNKHKINCYTDFCQLFTLEYINVKQTSDSHIVSQSSNQYSLATSQIMNDKGSNDKSIDHLVNTTTSFIPCQASSTDLNNPTSVHSLSSTISKGLIDKFIKDPIKFYGGKDSVINWLDEIEQQFHIMQLSDSDKLNLIQICLKSEAQQWYRQNRKSFISWSQFVAELKKSYHSNLQRDIGFKKLQQYHQTAHQSAFQYYNEMLKLIHQADPDMNESTKVHYLMNGLRPSLSIETRRNYPKTTQEFLTQVKIAEELTTLNTAFINHSMTHVESSPSMTLSYSKPINPTLDNEFNDYSTNSIINNDGYNNNYSSNNNNQHHYLNRIFKPSSYNSYNRNQSSNSFGQSYNVKQSSNSSSAFDNKTYRNNNFKQQQPFQRCSNCGSLNHIARHCHRFEKRGQ